MPRHKTKLVAIEGGETPARWQGADDVFFHRSQIQIGTRFLNFGRIAHGTLWEVVEIKSYRITRSGRAIPSRIDAVQKLSDDIVLRRLGSNEIRQLAFAGLSYSAIWRLA